MTASTLLTEGLVIKNATGEPATWEVQEEESVKCW